MTETERYLALCCSTAVSGKTCSDFPIWVDADTFYNLAFSHGVASMVYYAVKDAVGVPSELLAKLEDTHNKALFRDLYREEEEKRVFAAFDAADINYLPLKGSVLRLYYPIADMRVMGDTDLMIDKYTRKSARAVMESCGYIFDQSKSGHDIYHNENGNTYELHYMPEDKSQFHQKLMDRAIPVGNDGTCFSLNHSDFYIYMISHLARHVRTTGAGIRLFADIKVFYSRCGDKLDTKYVEAALKEMGLSDFERSVKLVIHSLFYGSQPDEQTQAFIDYIFSGGVFGSDENYFANRRGDKGRVAFFFSSVFPSSAKMKKRYPILEKAIVLLPLFWVVRWFSLLIRKEKPAKRFSASTAISSEQLKANKQLLTSLGLNNNKDGKVHMSAGDFAISMFTIVLLVFTIVFISLAFFQQAKDRDNGQDISSDSFDNSLNHELSQVEPPKQDYETIPYKNGVYKGYVSNGLPNGPGELVLPNGEKYIGTFADGEFNGQGVYRYLDGSYYDGMWFEGQINGYGTLAFADNSYIYANFIEGEPQGVCIYQNSNGDIYEGALKDGKRTGNGRFVWANGDVYEGNYVDGEREGLGKYTYANGDSYEGEWIASVPNGKGVMITGSVKYEGIFVQALLEGEGISTDNNGSTYKGYFVNGKYNDNKAIYTFSSGDKYEGPFVDGLFNGQGTFTYKDGDIAKGTFIDGLLQGTVIYYDRGTNTSKYVIYKNGKPA